MLDVLLMLFNYTRASQSANIDFRLVYSSPKGT